MSDQKIGQKSVGDGLNSDHFGYCLLYISDKSPTVFRSKPFSDRKYVGRTDYRHHFFPRIFSVGNWSEMSSPTVFWPYPTNLFGRKMGLFCSVSSISPSSVASLIK